jgi:serine/threonine-protein kinase
MVFVPAGEFLMGSQVGDGDADEHPQHTVYLEAFYIDITEVTNAMFARFVAETNYHTDAENAGKSFALVGIEWLSVSGADWEHPFGPSSDISGLEDHPVIHVSWNDAYAYCEWAGKRLPTEAEWEKAARGTDGATYPWGNSRPDSNLVNYADANTSFDWSVKTVDDGYKYTSPVGNYPDGASPYGVLDMAGNVWEWVADWYSKDYYSQSPESNPTGPVNGTIRVMRGGAWDDLIEGVRSAYRAAYKQTNTNGDTGFRCASTNQVIP